MAEGYTFDDDDDVDIHDDRRPLFAGPSADDADDGLVFDTLNREHIESDDLHGDHPRQVRWHASGRFKDTS